MITISLNMLAMACNYEGSPKVLTRSIEIANLVFNSIFICEMILKMLAFRGSYFKSYWNIFDFCIIMLSIIEIIID